MQYSAFKLEVQVLKDQINSLASTRSSDKGPPSNSGLTFKVALVGPHSGGKTRIAAQLAGLAIPPVDNYEPTQGVRILEFDQNFDAPHKKGDRSKYVSAKIELWDLSGETDGPETHAWPAACVDLLGVMVVFDPTSKTQANDVRIWCEWFIKAAKLKHGQCAIFAHGALTSRHKPLSVRAGLRKDDETTVSVPIVNVNFQLSREQEDGQMVEVPSGAKAEFELFMSGLWQHHKENSD